MKSHAPINILMAEDDPDDRMLTRQALEESRLINDLYFVEDGEELMAFLRHEGKYSLPDSSPRPGIILLDLNMPRKDGREALSEIKSDSNLRPIPVVILTTSTSERDVVQSYELGASSYIAKPVTFESLVEVVSALGRYWFEIVELPRDRDKS